MGLDISELNNAKGAVNLITSQKDLRERIKFTEWTRKVDLPIETLEQLLIDVAEGRSVRTAAERLKVSIFDVIRARLTNKDFNDAMNEALKLRLVLLEEKAWELAHEGESESQTQTGLGTYTRKKDSIAMVQFLLKAFNPEKYGVDRKEVRAGPLETPPEVIRGEQDRTKLLARIEQRRLARAEESAEEPIEAEITEVRVATLDELLS